LQDHVVGFCSGKDLRLSSASAVLARFAEIHHDILIAQFSL
jgi:hypothetical protein